MDIPPTDWLHGLLFFLLGISWASAACYYLYHAYQKRSAYKRAVSSSTSRNVILNADAWNFINNCGRSFTQMLVYAAAGRATPTPDKKIHITLNLMRDPDIQGLGISLYQQELGLK